MRPMPPRPAVTVAVFVSSTSLDLKPEREAVEASLQRMRDTKFVGMEYFGSRDETTEVASLDEVDRSQVYIGIFGGRYGSGITEREYRRAQERGLPCFIYFKAESAIDPSWRETDPDKSARLAALKQELRSPDRHTVTEFSNPHELAAKITADLHNWLVAQIGIGGEVIRSVVVSGSHNQVFVGDYQRLRDAYIQPWSVFRRVRLDRFVGRKWLTRQFDAFLSESSAGYFVLEAKAGLGKTALLAYLVKERGYIHHFVELAPGADGIGPGLKNLAAQLIRSWKLNPYGLDEVLPGAATRPDYLQTLLVEAARKRDEVAPGEKIVVVVDALDEAGTPAGQNVLGLPGVVPEGVYFLVSQRPVEVSLIVDTARRVVTLEAGDANNLADMRAYVELAAGLEKISQALRKSEFSPDQFVEKLLDKSRGVWIYLHYVVGEIERGERSPLELETLPQGVWQYYARYWQRWRREHTDEWDAIQLPLLTSLAAAQEDCSLKFLCSVSGVTAEPAARRLLEQAWIAFVTVTEGPAPRYRLHHSSLREFLDGRADASEMTSGERGFATEIAEATRSAHARFADRYFNAWGGLAAGLPNLKEPAAVQLDERYGLRHLVTHLEGAGRERDVQALFQLEWSEKDEPVGRRALNAWFAAHEQADDASGYLSDLSRARAMSERMSAGEARQGKIPASIGLEVRYAIIAASLRSLAWHIEPPLLEALVKYGVWSWGQALAYARNARYADVSAMGLAALFPHVPAEFKDDVLREALGIARKVSSPDERCKALSALARHVTGEPKEEILKEALAALRETSDYRYSTKIVEAMRELAPQFSESLVREASLFVWTIRNPDTCVEILIALAPYLPEPCLGDAIERTGALDDHHRGEALAGLAPSLPESLMEKTLEGAMKISDPSACAEALKNLVPFLPTPLLARILEIGRQLPDGYPRGALLASLVPRLPETARAQIIQEALQAARSIRVVSRSRLASALVPRLAAFFSRPRLRRPVLLILHPLLRRYVDATDPDNQSNGRRRAVVLGELAPYLGRGALREVVAASAEVQQLDHRAELLARLIPRLRGYARSRALRRALWAVHGIEDELGRSAALTKIAEHLPQDLLPKAVAVTGKMEDAGPRVNALASFIKRATGRFRDDVLREALKAARSIGAGFGKRAEALFELVPYVSEGEAKQLLRETVDARREIGDRYECEEVLCSLAPHLPRESRERAIAEGLAWIRKSSRDRARILAGLAPHLPDHLFGEALAAAREVAEHSADRLNSLIALVPHLPTRLLGKALATVDEYPTMGYRVQALKHLVPRLPASLFEKALASAKSIELGSRNLALTYLAGSVPDPMVDEFLEAASELNGSGERCQVYGSLASRLSGASRESCIEEAQKAYAELQGKDRLEVLPYLLQGLQGDALSAAAREAVALVLEIAREHDALPALLKLVPDLPEDARKEVVPIALELVERSAYVNSYLRDLAPHIPAALLPKALAMARQITPFVHELGPRPRVAALAALAARLPDPLREEVAREALLASDDPMRVFAQLGPFVSDALLEDLISQHKSSPPLLEWLAQLELPPSRLYPFWRDWFSQAITRLPSGTRKDLCAVLADAAAALAAIGGTEAVAEAYTSVQDAMRWWP
jgi:Domain of unknown function (DUF4062)